MIRFSNTGTGLLSIGLLLLTGCSSDRQLTHSEPPTSHLTATFRPAFHEGEDGTIIPEKCLSGHIDTFRHRPAGCHMERALASQVADKRDLMRPRKAGPALVRTIYPSEQDGTAGKQLNLETTNEAKRQSGQPSQPVTSDQ